MKVIDLFKGRAHRAEKHLDALASRQHAVWKDVERLVASKTARSYDEAVSLLEDIRDLAVRDNDECAFARRIGAVRERHVRKVSFIAKLDNAMLPKG